MTGIDSSDAAGEGVIPLSRKSVLFVASGLQELREIRVGLADMRSFWRLEYAVDAPNALAWVKEVPFDAIVVDLQMPRTNAPQLLRDVMHWRPDILRIGLTDSTLFDRLHHADAPTHQLLVQPLDPPALKAILSRAFAARQAVSEKHFRRLLGSIHSLPALPDLYVELTQELRSDNPSIDAMGEIISRDMALTARILQLVNSAFFGLTRTLTTPAEAAAFLGTETLQALVLSVQLFAQFEQVKHFDVRGLWRHSWATAILARRICEREGAYPDLVADAFIAGLLHDAGKLVLAANQPEKCAAVLAHAARHGTSFFEAEQEIYQASHADLGAYLLGRWGLPEAVVEAVAFHHQPSLARRQEFTALTAVHAANVLSKEKQLAQPLVSDPIDLDYLDGFSFRERVGSWHDLCSDNLPHAA